MWPQGVHHAIDGSVLMLHVGTQVQGKQVAAKSASRQLVKLKSKHTGQR